MSEQVNNLQDLAKWLSVLLILSLSASIFGLGLIVSKKILPPKLREKAWQNVAVLMLAFGLVGFLMCYFSINELTISSRSISVPAGPQHIKTVMPQ